MNAQYRQEVSRWNKKVMREKASIAESNVTVEQFHVILPGLVNDRTIVKLTSHHKMLTGRLMSGLSQSSLH